MQNNFTAVNTDCSDIFAIFGSGNRHLNNIKCIFAACAISLIILNTRI